MTTTTSTRAGIPNSLTSGQLPRYAPWAMLLVTFAISALLFILLSATGAAAGFNVAGFVVVGALLFYVVLYVFSFLIEGRRTAVNRLVTALVASAFILAVIPLISLVITVVGNGVGRLDLTFFTSSMRGVDPQHGGALHAIIGTLLVTLWASIISIPVGVMTSIYLVEYGRGAIARAITFFVDVMTGIPSIVAGLFAVSLFGIFFGPGVRMGFGGSVALSLLMIPIVVRSTEDMLRLVPNELREAAYALGVPKWLTIVKVVLPTAIAGITTGIMLAIARIIGETAPLLIVAGYTQNMNYDMFDPAGRMMTLPVFVYTQATNTSGAEGAANVATAWTGALVLILIVMLLNLAARLIAKIFAPRASRH